MRMPRGLCCMCMLVWAFLRWRLDSLGALVGQSDSCAMHSLGWVCEVMPKRRACLALNSQGMSCWRLCLTEALSSDRQLDRVAGCSELQLLALRPA